jgi:Protein of unknown function (DUF2970)
MVSESDRPPQADPESSSSPPRLTLLQIVGSTIAAALGVQSSRNRQRDFAAGRPAHFIVAGIVFTVLFVVTMVFVVRSVITLAA